MLTIKADKPVEGVIVDILGHVKIAAEGMGVPYVLNKMLESEAERDKLVTLLAAGIYWVERDETLPVATKLFYAFLSGLG